MEEVNNFAEQTAARGRVMDIGAMKQASDIAISEDIGVFGIFREKKYIKDKYMRTHYVHPRFLPFTEPFQVATYKTGFPWSVTNFACMVQLEGCNLDCDYCYTGDTAVKEVTSSEVVDSYWRDYYVRMLQGERQPTPVLRISGGEPLLQQRFVEGIVDEALFSYPYHISQWRENKLYLWVDTNLTQRPKGEGLLTSLARDSVGVCGCFKPVAAPDAFVEQLDNACLMIDAGIDLYFYYTCALDEFDKEYAMHGFGKNYDTCRQRWGSQFRAHLEQATDAIGPYYASRVHPVVIKYYYDALGLPEKEGHRMTQISRYKQSIFMSTLHHFICEELGSEYYWLPDYQVDVREGAMIR